MDLKTAIKNNKSKKVEELIDNKTAEEKINFIDTPINSSQDTPLNIAAMFNNIDIVKLLVEAGADLDIANDDNETPLQTAVHLGNIKIVEILIDKGADINTQDTINKYTPLHLAVSCPGEIDDKSYMRYFNIAELLIRSGANLETTDGQKKTPLHTLIYTCIRISIDDSYRGMDNSELYQKALQLVRLLIKKKVNVNAVDKKGNTPLHIALRNNDFELAYILKEADEKTTLIKNKNGKTPLQSIDGANLTRFEEFSKNKREMKLRMTEIVDDVLRSRKMPSHLAPSIAEYVLDGGKRTRARRPKRKRKKSKRNK